MPSAVQCKATMVVVAMMCVPNIALSTNLTILQSNAIQCIKVQCMVATMVCAPNLALFTKCTIWSFHLLQCAMVVGMVCAPHMALFIKCTYIFYFVEFPHSAICYGGCYGVCTKHGIVYPTPIRGHVPAASPGSITKCGGFRQKFSK